MSELLRNRSMFWINKINKKLQYFVWNHSHWNHVFCCLTHVWGQLAWFSNLSFPIAQLSDIFNQGRLAYIWFICSIEHSLQVWFKSVNLFLLYFSFFMLFQVLLPLKESGYQFSFLTSVPSPSLSKNPPLHTILHRVQSNVTWHVHSVSRNLFFV